MVLGWVLFLLLGGVSLAADTCSQCHQGMGGKLAAPVAAMARDVHAAKGLNCADCHGGDPTQSAQDKAMDPAKGFIGAPSPGAVPRMCSRCHSDPGFMKTYAPSLPVDQWEKYQTSVHGKRLAQGDTRVAECSSCHGAHGILSHTDPLSRVYPKNVPGTCGGCHADKSHMAPYRIPTDQLQEYRKSVHAQALLEENNPTAPACNDCHGNHGATPPGVKSVARVCGTCHPETEELFSKSVHSSAFAGLGLAGCEPCHGNHAVLKTGDEMLGTGKRGVCLQCHEKGSAEDKERAGMSQAISKLTSNYAQVSSQLDQASEKGVQVGKGTLRLADAKTALITARNHVHTYSAAEVDKLVQAGLKPVEEARLVAVAAEKEANFRRAGLAVSLVIILVLVVLLWLKIKDIDKNRTH